MRCKYSYKHINHVISNNLALPKPEEKIDRHASQTKPIINCLVYALKSFFLLTKAISKKSTNVGLDIVKMVELF